MLNVLVRTRRNGFTLIDLTISVLILGIVAAVASPSFADAMIKFRIEAAAKRIAGDFNYARKQAMAKSEAITIEVFTSPSRYVINGATNLDHGGTSTTITISDVDASITSTVPNFDGETSLQYSHYGLPVVVASGANLVSGSVVITMGSQTKTISIDPMTGKASVL